MTEEILLNVREVAEMLKVTSKTVRAMAKSKKLACVRLGYRTMRFTPEQIAEYVENFTCPSVMPEEPVNEYDKEDKKAAPKMKRLEVVCPWCGLIYKRLVEAAHADSPWAYRQAGFLVIICSDCRKKGALLCPK